ncbi:hypothetical protein CDAR_499011 [Caerostris darwini]|uniref:Uncharacterized protein n=1 Tax=Caerostris darwini TaxID=1538125 RepID=A0AAV4T359_9ARAC|nr:hypothetical protein CDAR_499011 [Caerostris darwini]
MHGHFHPPNRRETRQKRSLIWKIGDLKFNYNSKCKRPLVSFHKRRIQCHVYQLLIRDPRSPVMEELHLLLLSVCPVIQSISICMHMSPTSPLDIRD